MNQAVLEPIKQIEEPIISTTALQSIALASTLALAACGGGGGDGTSAGTPTTPPPPVTVIANPSFPKPATNEAASRFLQRSQFSANDSDIAALRASSYAEFLQTKFNESLGPKGWDWLEQRGYGVDDANSYFFNTYPAEFMIWNQLLSGPDVTRRRFALALSEYFVVSFTGSEFTWRSQAMAQYWDTLVNGAFGNFRQLLEDITLNPAMGYYLNTKGNQKEDPAKGRLPDENYSREVMQLFTIGLNLLNLDGTEKRDAQGNKIESYTAADVAGLAKVFTGYDFDTSDGVRLTPVNASYTIESKAYTRKPMLLNPSKHSVSSTTFLGVSVAANTPGAAALKTALDTLFNHPNAAPFFCKQMIQRLVTSSPSPAYVARVAAKFIDNGSGVRGDLKAVWAAILLDDEAISDQGLTSTTFGKLREPMLRFIQWGRTFNVKSIAGSWKMFDLSSAANGLGQSPLRSPSVFNFFRPGFIPPSTALAATSTPAPEFQLVNETTVGGYLNYMQDVIRNGISCPEPTLIEAAFRNYSRDVLPDYSAELALVADAPALVQRLNLLLCAGQLSAATQTLIVNALNATPITTTSTPAQKLDRVSAAVLLVMASSEYLIQK